MWHLHTIGIKKFKNIWSFWWNLLVKVICPHSFVLTHTFWVPGPCLYRILFWAWVLPASNTSVSLGKPLAPLDLRFSFCQMRGLAQVAKSSSRRRGPGACTCLLQTDNPHAANKPGLRSQARLELPVGLYFTLGGLLGLSEDQALPLPVSFSELLNALEQCSSTFFSLSSP